MRHGGGEDADGRGAAPGADRRRAARDLRPRLARGDRGADRQPRRRLAGARPPLFRRQGRPHPRHHGAPPRRVPRRPRRAASPAPTVRAPGSPPSSAAASARSSSTAPPSAPGSPSTPGRSPRPGAARLLRIYQRRLHSNLVHALKRLVPPPRPPASPRALGALIDGVYLREALRGRPTPPEAAIAIVEDLSRPRARRPPMTQPAASHWIAGAPFEDAAGDPFDVLYPATAEPIARLHAATPAVIERAVDARPRRLRRLVRHAARRPRPRPPPRRRPHPRPRPRARRARDPRHRQAPLRDAGRRLALRRRRARMVRRPRRHALHGEAIDLGGDLVLHPPRAARHLRRHRRLELPLARSPAGRPPRRSPAATR